MDYLIREYTKDDVAEIKECLIELQDFERIIDPHRLEGIHVAEEYLQNLLRLCGYGKGKIFVAEKHNGIIGMISVLIEEDKKHLRKTHRFAYISDLMILKMYRDKGVAKDLIQKAEEYAKAQHITTMQVPILARDHTYLNTYLHNGFHGYEMTLRKHI